ncbi:Ger(x)C family spore germination protein [Gracilibacillus caseinilyticus]|uniref:Ger(X)C family spore germination protein n=1 Tax=Gracilibacillus caseinilyticus TaxID=2932256 RepID=A0ABY4ESW8_9BACI|nr:Ger(x)C family spore germination protein [Gracilibacillus caseinilyticus]UOQ46968.1 Ger(x)C family spore germination protein [Gracilibacillus caseinilyticus]
MKHKCVTIFSGIIMLMLLTACWDTVELEDRAFVAGQALDIAEQQEQGDQTTFEMTEQLVVPSGLGTILRPGGGPAFRNISEAGQSLYDMDTKISRQINRVSNIEHLEISLISKEIAEKEGLFPKILDVFTRHQKMRRGLLIAVTEEKAADYLNVQPEHVKLPARYLSELLENKRVPVTTEPIRIGDVQEHLLNNQSFVIPVLQIVSDKVVEYKGLGVFRGQSGQMTGVLADDHAKGRNIIVGENQQGTITTTLLKEPITYFLDNGTSKFTLTNRVKDNLHFTVEIHLNARIAEYFGSMEMYSKKNQNKLKKALEKRIEKIAQDAVTKVKDDLQVDIFTFDDYLRIHHYDFWQDIKQNWDTGENYFSKSTIKVVVDADIEQPGNTYQVKNKKERN